MRVKCINRGGAALLEADILAGNFRTSTFGGVTVGQTYVVYGLLVWKSSLDYLIQADNGSPYWVPASLFEITSKNLSRLWQFNSWHQDGQYVAIATFSIFVNSRKGLEALACLEPTAVNDFQYFKEMADLEFPIDVIDETAISLKDNWIQCVSCSDAWESQSFLALVRCPSCGRTMNNPRALKEGQ
jgi:hypothetical protein